MILKVELFGGLGSGSYRLSEGQSECNLSTDTTSVQEGLFYTKISAKGHGEFYFSFEVIDVEGFLRRGAIR